MIQALLADDSTRLKFGLIIVGVVFAEAVLRTFFPQFPFMEAIGVQAGVYATFVTGRTVTDVKGNGGQVVISHEE